MKAAEALVLILALSGVEPRSRVWQQPESSSRDLSVGIGIGVEDGTDDGPDIPSDGDPQKDLNVRVQNSPVSGLQYQLLNPQLPNQPPVYTNTAPDWYTQKLLLETNPLPPVTNQVQPYLYTPPPPIRADYLPSIPATRFYNFIPNDYLFRRPSMPNFLDDNSNDLYRYSVSGDLIRSPWRRFYFDRFRDRYLHPPHFGDVQVIPDYFGDIQSDFPPQKLELRDSLFDVTPDPFAGRFVRNLLEPRRSRYDGSEKEMKFVTDDLGRPIAAAYPSTRKVGAFRIRNDKGYHVMMDVPKTPEGDGLLVMDMKATVYRPVS